MIDEDRGFASFCKLCEVIHSKLDTNGVDRIVRVASRQPGLETANEIFVAVFESMIAASRCFGTSDSMLEDCCNRLTADVNVIAPKGWQPNATYPTPVSQALLIDIALRCYAMATARSFSRSPSQEQLRTEFQRCRKAWEADCIQYEIACATTDFYSEPMDLEVAVGSFRLKSNYGITPVERLLNSYNNVDQVYLGERSSINNLYWTQVIDVPKSKQLGEVARRYQQELVNVFTALRLLGHTGLFGGMICLCPSSASEHAFSLSSLVLDNPQIHGTSWHVLPVTAFTEESVCAANREYSLVSKHFGDFETPLERFNLACSRESLEDRIIDLTIALESVLCHGNKQDQLSYRFRLHGAALAMINENVSRDVVKLLGGLYALRSAIVHSGKKLASSEKDSQIKVNLLGLTPIEFVEKVISVGIGILRQAISLADRGLLPCDYPNVLTAHMAESAGLYLRTYGKTDCV